MGASMRTLDPTAAGAVQGLSVDSRFQSRRAAAGHRARDAAQARTVRSGLRAPTAHALDGRHIGLLFEKPSLRTRVTFTIGVRELGGDMVEIPADVMHADREPIHDVARNLERWVDAVVIRTFSQERLVQIGQTTTRLHVINALSDEQHPCQALADIQTLLELWGSLAGPHGGVRRRRQQRRDLDGARSGDAGHLGARRDAERLRAARPGRCSRPRAWPPTAPSVVQFTDPKKGGRGRRRRLHRCLDVDGTGSRIRRAQEDLLPLPGQRRR